MTVNSQLIMIILKEYILAWLAIITVSTAVNLHSVHAQYEQICYRQSTRNSKKAASGKRSFKH